MNIMETTSANLFRPITADKTVFYRAINEIRPGFWVQQGAGMSWPCRETSMEPSGA